MTNIFLWAVQYAKRHTHFHTIRRPKWSLKKKKKKEEEKSDPDGKLRKKKIETEAITMYKDTKSELTQRLDTLSSRGRWVKDTLSISCFLEYDDIDNVVLGKALCVGILFLFRNTVS